MNHTITCNPDGCYIVDKYAKEIMNNCNCCNSMNAKTEDSNTEKAMTALGMLIVINELSKKSDMIKELQTENSKLKEENAALKKENELLNRCYKISEELRDRCKEKTVIKLKKEVKDLEEKIQNLKSDLFKQTQLNVYLVDSLKNSEK